MWALLLILKIILYLFAALLLILVTLLIVPFTYKGEAEVYGGITFSYRIGWFWNLFNIRGTRGEEQQTTAVYLANKKLFTVKTPKNKEEEQEEPDEAKVKEAEGKKDNDLKSLFDTKLIKEAFSYLNKVVRQISPKYLHLYGTYGFDDPSITGMTAGFIYTLQGVWPQSRIHLQPSFIEEIIELELKAAGRVYAGKLVWDTGRFLLKPEVRTKVFKKKKKLKPKAS